MHDVVENGVIPSDKRLDRHTILITADASVLG
jgi:hypothetical protein